MAKEAWWTDMAKKNDRKEYNKLKKKKADKMQEKLNEKMQRDEEMERMRRWTIIRTGKKENSRQSSVFCFFVASYWQSWK